VLRAILYPGVARVRTIQDTSPRGVLHM